MTKFYNLPKDSELETTIQGICLALETGRTTVTYAGDIVHQKVSRKGTRFFTMNAGLPVHVSVFEGAGGHTIVMNLGLSSVVDTGVEVIENRVSVRGRVKIDSRGRPNVFFFDPYEDGRKRGSLEGKLELVQKGLVEPKDAFTEEEVRVHRMARNLTEDEASSLLAEVAHA